MKRLLITGFAPFGGDRINPSWQAVSALPETVGGWELVKRELPVTFRGAPKALFEAMDEAEPDAVLMVGLAGSRGAVTPERQGFNEIVARIPDNEGCQPQNEPVIPGGPEVLYSTLPVEDMTEAILAAGVPARFSESAGRFVCNTLLYAGPLSAGAVRRSRARRLHPRARHPRAGGGEGSAHVDFGSDRRRADSRH